MNKIYGTHLIIELSGVDFNLLNNINDIRDIMIHSVKDCNATVLYSYFHPFSPQGVTGVLLLAESHMSIHTFPEDGYASLDVYMCYDMKPKRSLPKLLDYFKPKNYKIESIKRGI